MAKLWVLLLCAAAGVSAVPIAQSHDDAVTTSIHLTNGHSFFQSTINKRESPSPVKDYCGTIPVKPATKVHQDATATYANHGSFQTLAATVHWSVDTQVAENVIPTPPEKPTQFYYGIDKPTKSGYYAFLTYNFTTPSVNLDHCNDVTVTYNNVQGLQVTFHSDKAFNYASDTWKTNGGLVLVASADGCGGSANGDRCYFKVSALSIKIGDRTIVAKGEPSHPDELITSAETEWGWWDAESNPSSDEQSFTAEFDRDLDTKLGYAPMDMESQAFLEKVAPDNLSTDARCIGNGTLLSRNLGPLASRSFWSWIQDNIIHPIVDAYHTVRDALTITGSIGEQFAWDLPGPDVPTQQSAWGDAILLQSFGDHQPNTETGLSHYMDIFCVGCGVSGQAKVAGRAGWTPLGGFVEGHVELQTNIKFALKVGIDAQIKYSKSFDTELFNIGLPGLSFGVVTVGPSVAVSARVALEAAAAGKLLVGAEMGLEDARAVLDIVDSSKSSSSGWDPYFKPVLEAEGELMLAASIGLPVSIRCGVQVSQWQVSVGVIDEPSVSATAQVAGSIGLAEAGGFAGAFKDVDGCAGISAQVSWRNKLYVDILGLSTIPLHDTDNRPLLRQCLSFQPGSKQNQPLPQSHRNSVAASPAQFLNVSSPQSDNSDIPHAKIASNSSNVCDIASPVIYSGRFGFTLSPLVSTSGMAKVISCANGNVYAATNNNNTNSDCSENWATAEDATIGYDGSFRSMHYYADTMTDLGVSRLRLSAPSQTPKGTVPVALVAYANDNGPDFYVAADRHHQVFYPIVCDYQRGAGSKVFLAKDPILGVKALQDAGLVTSLTGGKIEQCYSLALSPI